MNLEEKVKQHDELISELIQLEQTTSKQLLILKRLQSIAIPSLLITGFSGVLALLKVFGIF